MRTIKFRGTWESKPLEVSITIKPKKATCAGEDSFAAYLILKRETLHTSKQP